MWTEEIAQQDYRTADFSNIHCRSFFPLLITANSSFSKLVLKHQEACRSYKERAQCSGCPCGGEPPCFPPIPSSNEDQRRGYQALYQPWVHFTCVWMNLHSCAEPRELRGSRCRALSAFLGGGGQWNQRGLSGADKRRLGADRRHLSVWLCDSVRRPPGSRRLLLSYFQAFCGDFVSDWQEGVDPQTLLCSSN